MIEVLQTSWHAVLKNQYPQIRQTPQLTTAQKSTTLGLGAQVLIFAAPSAKIQSSTQRAR